MVKTFLPRSKHLLISCLQSPSAVILEPPKIKSVTVSTVSLATLRLSPVAVIRGYSPVAACGLLIAVVSLVASSGLLFSSCDV